MIIGNVYLVAHLLLNGGIGLIQMIFKYISHRGEFDQALRAESLHRCTRTTTTASDQTHFQQPVPGRYRFPTKSHIHSNSSSCDGSPCIFDKLPASFTGS